jgi:hypothetical protein
MSEAARKDFHTKAEEKLVSTPVLNSRSHS